MKISLFIIPFVVNLATGKRRVVKSGKGMRPGSSRKGRKRINRHDEVEINDTLPPPPPGAGIKKKKKRRRPKDEDYIPPKPADYDDDDGRVESFMVNLEEAENHKRDVKRDRIGREPVVKSIKFADEKNGRPAFGESLNVGFKGRNHKARQRRQSGKRKRGRELGESRELRELRELRESDDTEPVITNVDEESIIEWDSGTVSEDEVPTHEFYCRNCDEQIPRKYIKYFYKNDGAERIKVNGPFCSKMCSLEYSE